MSSRSRDKFEAPTKTDSRGDASVSPVQLSRSARIRCVLLVDDHAAGDSVFPSFEDVEIDSARGRFAQSVAAVPVCGVSPASVGASIVPT